MSLWDKLFGKQRDPSAEAMQYINQIPGQVHGAYDPYIAAGQQALPGLQGKFGEMSNDPAAFINKLMESYEPSKAYQAKRDEALRAAGNTAAAGGYRGTEEDLLNNARLTQALMGDDMQGWLNNVLGAQGAGLSGLQNLYQTGFGASQGLSGDLSNVLGTQGGLAFQGAREHNQKRNDIFSGLGGLLGGAAGAYFGGLPGAQAGYKIGSGIGGGM